MILIIAFATGIVAFFLLLLGYLMWSTSRDEKAVATLQKLQQLEGTELDKSQGARQFRDAMETDVLLEQERIRGQPPHVL
jgi:hypothetical protein